MAELRLQLALVPTSDVTLAFFTQPVWDGMPIQGYGHGTRNIFVRNVSPSTESVDGLTGRETA